ncbi:MAG: response regulator [Angelakisella sp.]
MYKAIIIDDEKLIREGLVHYIDWEGLGISVCATCEDGIKGMEAVMEHHPQIILSDISMPNLSGIQLLEQIRSYGLSCEVIFISSYSDFGYAQQALKLGAFDYLLKPIEAHVLAETVGRCVERLDGLHRTTKDEGEVVADLDKMLLDALTTLPQSEQVFLGLARRCGMETDGETMVMVTVYNSKDRLEQLLKENVNLHRALVVELSATVSAACLFFVRGKAAEACEQLEEQLGSHGLVGAAVTCPGGVYQGFIETEVRLLLEREPCSDCPEVAAAIPHKGVAGDIIECLSADKLESALASFLRESYGNGEVNHFVSFMMRCISVFEGCYHQLEQYYGAPLQGCREMGYYLKTLQQTNNAVDLYICLKNLLSDIFCTLRFKSMMNPYTRSALRIIHEQYSENLSLKQIAHQISVSASHLSMVFKEDTGYSFSDYLYRYRMNAAQELIKKEEYKVYEIGAMVGYPDMVQFSKRFKHFFGYSPKQWQRSTLGREK